MSFSDNLRSAMQDREVTNYRLAKDIAVHESTIKNWLDGITPRLEHAQKVASYFGKTLDEMMLGSTTPKE